MKTVRFRRKALLTLLLLVFFSGALFALFHLTSPNPPPSMSASAPNAPPLQPPNSTLNYACHLFYYPWYGNPQTDGEYLHWNHEYLPHWQPKENSKWPKGRHIPPDDIGSNFYPKLGCYSSRDPSVMRQHMSWIVESGAGVLAVSWYPPGLADSQGKDWDSWLPTLFDIASEYFLKIAFHIEPYTGRNASNMRTNIAYIIDRYGEHPAFYRYTVKPESKMGKRRRFKEPKSLPLIYVYDSYLVAASEWKSLLADHDTSIRGTALDAIMIGLSVQMTDHTQLFAQGFDGFFTYFAVDAFTHASSWRNWRKMGMFARSHGLLFIPSVGPGYVDERVRAWNAQNTRQRKDGEYYKEAWGYALESRAEVISVTSFNEWHEGTQIEPAVEKKAGFEYWNYGALGEKGYLEITKEFVGKMSGGKGE